MSTPPCDYGCGQEAALVCVEQDGRERWVSCEECFQAMYGGRSHSVCAYPPLSWEEEDKS